MERGPNQPPLERGPTSHTSPAAVILFPEVEKPQVSVLIVGLRDAPFLVECLGSIEENAPDSIYEVIVVLNDPSVRLCTELRRTVRTARTTAFRANLGFGWAVNYAARQARGEYLVLTNDDCKVSKGWLESLIDTAERRPRSGLVGSTFLDPDGTLQEAGAVIWSDGITAPVVAGQSFGDARFERRVDYCSAGSLLVRRDVWRQLGGFDDRYYPGYYEDVDLCLRALQAGWEVWYQPDSVVYHRRSTSTTESERGFLHQRAGRIFTERWSEFLQHQQPNGELDKAIRQAMDRPLPAVPVDRPPIGDIPAGSAENTTELEVAALRRELELRLAYNASLEGVIRQKEEHADWLHRHIDHMTHVFDAERDRVADQLRHAAHELEIERDRTAEALASLEIAEQTLAAERTRISYAIAQRWTARLDRHPALARLLRRATRRWRPRAT